MLPSDSFQQPNTVWSKGDTLPFSWKYQKNVTTHWLVQATVSNFGMALHTQTCMWMGEICSVALLSLYETEVHCNTPDLTPKHRLSVGLSVMLPEFIFQSSGMLANHADYITWKIPVLQSSLLFISKVLASSGFYLCMRLLLSDHQDAFVHIHTDTFTRQTNIKNSKSTSSLPKTLFIHHQWETQISVHILALQLLTAMIPLLKRSLLLFQFSWHFTHHSMNKTVPVQESWQTSKGLNTLSLTGRLVLCFTKATQGKINPVLKISLRILVYRTQTNWARIEFKIKCHLHDCFYRLYILCCWKFYYRKRADKYK